MKRHDPHNSFLVVGLLLTAALSAVLWRFGVRPVFAYLAGISLVTFLFYGYDKRQAATNRARIPELVLHLLALAGGTGGALLGQILWRHKTKKLQFKLVFAIIVLIQAVLVFACWKYFMSSG